MLEARTSRLLLQGGRVLALCGALGSIACGRSSQARSYPYPVDMTSPDRPVWTADPAPAEEPQLTDEHVERIAVRVPRGRVPRVSQQNPSKGSTSAKVVLQIFSDFQCPFCARSAETLQRVEADFRGRIRIVWRNYPLPAHRRARPAARAALAAFAQGGSVGFWKFHDWLFSPQADLSDAGLRRGAAALGLDAEAVERAARTTTYDPPIAADIAAGDSAGIEGTPAVFINDYYLVGARYRSEYAIVVERALREAP